MDRQHLPEHPIVTIDNAERALRSELNGRDDTEVLLWLRWAAYTERGVIQTLFAAEPTVHDLARLDPRDRRELATHMRRIADLVDPANAPELAFPPASPGRDLFSDAPTPGVPPCQQ